MVPVFDPPLSVLRYRRVADVLCERGVERFVDVGCGDCGGMVQMLSRRSPATWGGGNAPGRMILAVGVDKVRQAGEGVAGRGFGGNAYLPMHISLWEGDVVHADTADLAAYLHTNDVRTCTCVEVLEHVPRADLPALTEKLLGEEFGFDLVIVTTPNRDANCLMGMAAGQRRHWDHRFELSEDEFVAWAAAAAQRYNYSFQLHGAGFLGEPLERGRRLVPVSSPVENEECTVPATCIAVFTAEAPRADAAITAAAAAASGGYEQQTSECTIPECVRRGESGLPTCAGRGYLRLEGKRQGAVHDDRRGRGGAVVREVLSEATAHAWLVADLAHGVHSALVHDLHVPAGVWTPLAHLVHHGRVAHVWQSSPELHAHLLRHPPAARDGELAAYVGRLLLQAAATAHTHGVSVDNAARPTAVVHGDCLWCGTPCECASEPDR